MSMGMNKLYLSPEQKIEVYDLWKKGIKPKDIVEKVGVRLASINQLLWKFKHSKNQDELINDLRAKRLKDILDDTLEV